MSLTLSAPEHCPAREVLVRRARQRAAWIHFTETSDPDGLAVEVVITKHARDYAAMIVLASGEGLEERTLTAATCAELVDASGLVIALLVQEKGPSAQDAQAAEPSAAPAPAAPEPTPVALEPSPARERLVTPAAARAWSPFVGGAMETELAVLPAATTGGAVFAGVERPGGLVSPSLRLEASLTTSDLASGPSRAGSFVRGVVRADVCPLRFALGDALSLRPCAWAGLGAVHAAGAAVPKSLSETDLWSDVGAVLRGRVASRSAFLELEAGAVVPLTRPVFVVENPRSVVFSTPPVGMLVALGGGVRFL